MNNSAFISYRRDVSAFMARAIFQDLRSNGHDVFMDVESIDSGEFDAVILNQIAARPYFLLVLTPGTLDRCNEPDDWVRREIEHAIDLKRVIVPLTTPNFSFSAAQPYLTGKLNGLSRYNGIEVPHSYFEEAMERLRKRFLKPIELSTTPTPVEDQSVVQHKIEQAAAEPTVTEQELSAQDYFERAYARADHDQEGKITDYTEAIRLNPGLVYAFVNRSLARHELGDNDGAIADCTEAIRLNPKTALAYNNRGWYYYCKGNYKQAIADCSEAIQHNPLDASFYHSRGTALGAKGDYALAIADFRKALRIAPDHHLAQEMRDRINDWSNHHRLS